MSNRKGICCAGNMIVDITYPISSWPSEGELVHITEGLATSTGGCVCNTVTDLARLDPKLELTACGFAGHDAEGDSILQELGKYQNIDLSMVRRDGRTSFTAVMSNNESKVRTFFQHAGANAYFSEEHVDLEKLNCKIFHIGYILLLPALDAHDEEYGTRMARLLHSAQKFGMKTSIDVVSETGNRFVKLVPPALKYSDYCIINEVEAQATTGIILRSKDGSLVEGNMEKALQTLFDFGVSEWAVIHCPEAGFGMDSKGEFCRHNSLKLPSGYIKGSVGAGDAFCAGVLYAAQKDMTLSEALKLGACTAAASLSHLSASNGVKTVDEVLNLSEIYK